MEKRTTQTEVNKKRLIHAATFEKAVLEGMMEDDLAAALTKLFEKKQTNASQIATVTGISRSYVTELQKNKRGHKNPGRRVLIAICLAAGANLEETDYVLKSARLKELYARDEADALIIWALAHGKEYMQILELLDSHGYGNYLGNE